MGKAERGTKIQLLMELINRFNIALLNYAEIKHSDWIK